MTGLYIHIPFCASKCPYCDFYSLRGKEGLIGGYTGALKDEIRSLSRVSELAGTPRLDLDTVYMGGGTPSLLGGETAAGIIKEVFSSHNVSDDAEITIECNPSSADESFFSGLGGVFNRVSVGLQSAVETERRALGRLTGAEAAKKTVAAARNSGVTNISLDLMLGIPGQTAGSLDKSLDFCLRAGVPHISVYMLSLEEGTPFYRMRDRLELPGEDEVCDMYLHTAERLEKEGLPRYEISNFARPGYESRHNMKYWLGEEYLGLGASAHSFIGGRRFAFDRDAEAFIRGEPPKQYDSGGDAREYVMLRLRLREGLSLSGLREKYGVTPPPELHDICAPMVRGGLVCAGDDRIYLTPEGSLVSNHIISEILSAFNL